MEIICERKKIDPLCRSGTLYFGGLPPQPCSSYRSLWGFDAVQEGVNGLYDTPSSNMATLQNRTDESQDLGCILDDHTLCFVELDQAKIYTGWSVDLDECISINPFYDSDRGGTHHNVPLTQDTTESE